MAKRRGIPRGILILRAVPWSGGLLPFLVLLFTLVRVGEATATAPGWVRGYGDDLLCLPLVLSLALTARRWRGGPGSRRLPLSHGILAVVLFTVFFECVLPGRVVSATADPWDIVMYLAGFGIFQAGLNRSVSGRVSLRTGSFMPTFHG